MNIYINKSISLAKKKKKQTFSKKKIICIFLLKELKIPKYNNSFSFPLKKKNSSSIYIYVGAKV